MRIRRRAARWTIAAALLTPAVAGLVAPPASAEVPITVRGRVTDEAGEALPGHAVRLLKSRSVVHLGSLRTREQNIEELRATTDEHGFFEFDFPADPSFPYYFVRFYDPKTFDAVKYRLPEDRDISRQVRTGRLVQAHVVLRLHQEWPRVKALLEEFGPGSHCGQILRALGLPTRRTPEGPGRELWVFDGAKVAYVVEGSKVLETRRLDAAAQTSVPAAPVPAEREER